MSGRYLVYGVAIAGAAVVRALTQRGLDVEVADDAGTEAVRRIADELGVELVVAPEPEELAALVERCDVVVPAPGVPETHPLFDVARHAGRPVRSELELAYRWEQERAGGPRPMLAVTGTDGKTTVTLWATEMLRAGGLRAVAAGNTDVPLVAALDLDVDAFVVECTSFRLAATEQFRGDAAVWLNLAQDHLNWHTSMASYEAAKARVFTQQRATDTAIGAIADPVVMEHLASAPARHRTFGLRDADYHVAGGVLQGPSGALVPTSALARSLPHDLTNGLAAAALVLEPGLVGADAVARRVDVVHRTAAPHRAGGGVRRHPVVQRLQGDDTARRVGGHPGLRQHRPHRRRAEQGARPPADGSRANAHPCRRRHRP